MPKLPGFVGPTYVSQSPVADAELCMNFYVEVLEGIGAKARTALYPRPGLAAEYAIVAGPANSNDCVRRIFEINGRTFAIAGDLFVELFADGTFNLIGPVANDNQPVSMVSNGVALFFVSAGVPYVFGLVSGALNVVPFFAGPPAIPISFIGFCDGFFLALTSNSRTWYVSSLEDANTWDALDFVTVSIFPDNIVSLLVDHREVWLFGITKTCVYYNSGHADQPFQPVESAFIEQGCVAPNTPQRLDNSIFWLGGDERGAGVVWRANGYTPVRVSNHALEWAIQRYTRIDNAVGFTAQMMGHSFYFLRFPTATPDLSVTWVLDVATGQWVNWDFFDTNYGSSNSYRSMCHCYAFGKHLMGDWQGGTIYRADPAVYKDGEAMIRRVRRAMDQPSDEDWEYCKEFLLDLEVGLGLQSGQGVDPQVVLRWSDDGGKTWSNGMSLSAGAVGEYGIEVVGRRLGRWRGFRPRVWESSMTDPIPWRLIGASRS